MRKRKILLIAGACLASLSLAVGAAAADPATTPRNLNGVGSDTTQGVMNALGKVVSLSTPPNGGTAGLQIGSWDVTGTNPFNTGKAGCNAVARPSGSGAGIAALVADRNAATHCLQFARSSADSHSTNVGNHLTYIPFATDAVAYAVRGPGGSPTGSNISRSLPATTLTSLYNQQGTCNANFQLLMPQFGSGTRKFFIENVLGLGPDSATWTSTHPCVSDLNPDGSGTPLLENTGNLLTNDKQLEPYSVSSWIAQTTKNVPDVHGVTLLGNINNTPSLALNATAPGVRPVFNVVPNVLIAPGTNSNAVFVGPTSQVCSNTTTILQQGFATRTDCGSTAIQSDAATGSDTVGAGE
jgi:ABC-type phosphate transport system substrate-binding protein